MSKFEEYVNDFCELDDTLPDRLVEANFLHKIRTHSLFADFYTTITTLPEDLRNFDYIRSTFLDITNTQYQPTTDQNSKSYSAFICSLCELEDAIRNSDLPLSVRSAIYLG